MSLSRELPRILILTPVKDAARFLKGYCQRILSLTYPKNRISIGFLESDSQDGSYEALAEHVRELQTVVGRAALYKKDFGFQLPTGVPRWAPGYQLARRSILAKARNTLLFRALRDEDWVMWLDADVVEFPCDLIEQLLAYDLDIVHPNCVLDHGGETFDRNGWTEGGRKFLHDFRGHKRPVRLQSVGGTVLLVRAELHREGLVFPSYLYGLESKIIRSVHDVWGKGEIETEGFAMMAADMGYQCWGLPDLEVRHEKH